MNNYYDLAEDDLLEAHDRYSAERYNKCAVWCQQASEKYLKYILFDKMGVGMDINGDNIEDDKSLFHEHRLKVLYDRINRDNRVLNISASALFSLSNYYTKARYPGDGFVEVDVKLADNLLKHTEDIKNAVDNYLGFNSTELDLSTLTEKYK